MLRGTGCPLCAGVEGWGWSGAPGRARGLDDRFGGGKTGLWDVYRIYIQSRNSKAGRFRGRGDPELGAFCPSTDKGVLRDQVVG